MGQESLNFEQPEGIPIARINRTPSIRNVSNKSDLEQTREIEARYARERKEKYSFLEEVPNWEDKFKKYEFRKNIEDKKIKRFYHDFIGARSQADDLNDRYGDGSATYIPMTEDGRAGYSISFNTPLRPEFDEILDSDGNLLPSKNSHRLAS